MKIGRDTNTQYTTTYEVSNNETIILKWDLLNWKDYISNNTVSSSMPTTILKYKQNDYNAYILESDIVFDDPFEGTVALSLHKSV